MKIAVIGEGPSALEAAIYFKSIDCFVSIFSESSSNHNFFDLLPEGSTLETTSLGLDEISKVADATNENNLTAEDYKKNYFDVLWNKFLEAGIVRECKVSRITKAHFDVAYHPEGKTRLCDLFRVTFEMNVEKMIEEQAKLNEMAFNNISPDAIQSLKRSIEMAEDFDLVILAKDSFDENKFVGVGNSPCLNELYFNKEDQFLTTDQWGEDSLKGSIALVGGANKISYSLFKLKIFLEKNLTSPVFIICEEKNFLENIGKTKNKLVNEYVNEIKKNIATFYQDEEVRVEAEMKKWSSLEDYERVKFPRPTMKEPQYRILSGMTVLSIDRLDESEKYYLTLEPVKDVNQLEDFLGVTTISCDALINAKNGQFDDSKTRGLMIGHHELASNQVTFENEPGLFNISCQDELSFQLEKFQEKITVIRTEINKYFTKQGE